VTKKALVAVDLGGESCRVSLLTWHNQTPRLQLVHRFANGPVIQGHCLRWDIHRICEGIETGLRLCAEVTSEGIAAIGIDGWGVDYVRIQPGGQPKSNPFCYRDERTVEAEKQIHQSISRQRLYQLTGILPLRFNTLYQLYADRAAGDDQGLPWIQIPEFLTHRMGGEPVCEYTNATHSGLLSLDSRDWCPEIFAATGLNRQATHRIVPPGSMVGQVKPELQGSPALKHTQLIVPACHDTASAIAGIPAEGDDWAYLSSGTWSLVGTLLDSACATSEALAGNFSNMGGTGGKICFLRNVNGMWLLSQCMEQWKLQGYEVPWHQLIEACSTLPAPKQLLDVDEPEFMLPGNMPAAINAYLVRKGRSTISGDREGIVQMANLIFHSLATRYAQVLEDLVATTKKKIRRLYIVGGGSRNALLNRLTAERTSLEVFTGAAESSTIGNLAIQLASLDGEYSPATGVGQTAVAKWAQRLSPSSRS
jgi:rhamnulokinase